MCARPGGEAPRKSRPHPLVRARAWFLVLHDFHERATFVEPSLSLAHLEQVFVARRLVPHPAFLFLISPSHAVEVLVTRSWCHHLHTHRPAMSCRVVPVTPGAELPQIAQTVKIAAPIPSARLRPIPSCVTGPLPERLLAHSKKPSRFVGRHDAAPICGFQFNRRVCTHALSLRFLCRPPSSCILESVSRSSHSYWIHQSKSKTDEGVSGIRTWPTQRPGGSQRG